MRQTQVRFDNLNAKLDRVARECGYALDYRPMVRRRGWPTVSVRPFHILYTDGTLCASFATIEAMERNLRGRCGC